MASSSNNGTLLALGAASLLAVGGVVRGRGRMGSRATEIVSPDLLRTLPTEHLREIVIDTLARSAGARPRHEIISLCKRFDERTLRDRSFWEGLASQVQSSRGSASIGTVLSDGTRLSEQNKGILCGALSGLLAVLRAMHIAIHEGHWTASGPNFYSDHLLLERVYAGTGGGPVLQDDIDGLGERIVAYCGPEFVDSRVVTKKALGLIDAWHDATPSPVSRALHAEESLQVALRAVYDALRRTADEGGGPVPLGLDDFLMAMASAHDTNRYLLQQRVSPQDRP